jgi:transcriptional regulator with XRE-family HTH domain
VLLKIYLESRGISQKEFSKMLGISQSSLSYYLNKKREPSLRIAKKIVSLTKGKVTIDDLLREKYG